MLRRLFTVLSAVSLVLAALFAAASFTQPVGYVVVQPLGVERPYTAKEAMAFKPPPPAFDFAGFRVQRSVRVQYTYREVRVFTIPYWFLATLCLLPPGLWLRDFAKRSRRSRRVRRGWCRDCGHDLQASPGPCPECGASPVESRPPAPRRAGGA